MNCCPGSTVMFLERFPINGLSSDIVARNSGKVLIVTSLSMVNGGSKTRGNSCGSRLLISGSFLCQ